ncbi:MAG: L,D-transpeptidase family protein [Alphaproteobacteria bacterium]|nr:L,D-transpeptidase family protein [Alphaproteobacteria bacterium]
MRALVLALVLVTGAISLAHAQEQTQAPPPGAAAVQLHYAGGKLSWPGGSVRAAVGKGGVRRDKREGDGATPTGTFPLMSVLYRPDRIKPPETSLPLQPLHRDDLWVDDPADPRYNTLVSLPYPAHGEHMWRDDGVYDLLVVIGYNMGPVTPGAGSAIFLHIARPSFSPTVGCVAVARETLLALVSMLGSGSTITIEP